MMCSDTDEERYVVLHVHGVLHVHNGCSLLVTAETATGPK